jgi:hypothetical protein
VIAQSVGGANFVRISSSPPGARACMFRVHADVPTFGHLGEGVSVSHPVRAFVIKAVYTHTPPYTVHTHTLQAQAAIQGSTHRNETDGATVTCGYWIGRRLMAVDFYHGGS